jgi:hypothetical protein
MTFTYNLYKKNCGGGMLARTGIVLDAGYLTLWTEMRTLVNRKDFLRIKCGSYLLRPVH